MADVKDLVIELTLQNDKLKKELKNTQAGLKKTTKATSLLKTGLIAAAAAFVAKKIVGGFKAVIKSAIDAQETVSKFNTVFKDVQDEADNVAKNLAENFGLSSTAAKKLLGDTGDLLSGFGFTGKAALDMSQKVNELAVDLASFTNAQGGAEAVSAALTKSLLGETESLKTYGIAILQADVQAKVLQLRQEGLTFASERQAKSYATLALAQEQSKNAIGDFARTSDQTANTIRVLQANLSEIGVAIGTFFLPAVADGIKLILKLTKAIRGLKDEGETIFDIRKQEAFNEVTEKINRANEKGGFTLKKINKQLAIQNNFLADALAEQESLIESKKESAVIDLENNRLQVAIAQGTILALEEEINKREAVKREKIAAAKTDVSIKIFSDEEIKKIDAQTAAFLKANDDDVLNNKLRLLQIELEQIDAQKDIKLEKLRVELEAKKLTEDEFRLAKEQIEIQANQKRIELTESTAETLKEINNEELKNFQDNAAEKIEAVNKFTRLAKTAGDDLITINKSNLASLKENRDKASGDDRVRLDKEIDAQKKKLHEIAVFNKRLKIAQATIDGLSGVVKALSATPWPIVNAGLAAATAVATGIRIKAIKTEKIPEFQEGGVIREVAQSAMTSEDGIIGVQRGEAILNRSATMELGEETIDRLNAGYSSGDVNITIVNPKDTDEVVEVLNDYFRQYGDSQRGVAV